MTTSTPDTTRLTDADLDRIEAEAADATPGLWHRFLMPSFVGERVVDDEDRFYIAQELLPENAQFIAASRTNIPALIAEVRRQRKRIAALEEALGVVITEAGSIWDDSHPVHPAHGSRLDAILYEAKTALASAGDVGREGE